MSWARKPAACECEQRRLRPVPSYTISQCLALQRSSRYASARTAVPKRNSPFVQRAEITEMIVQGLELRKAELERNPESYDNWLSMGELSLEIALADVEQGQRCLMEVSLMDRRIQSFDNATNYTNI